MFGGIARGLKGVVMDPLKGAKHGGVGGFVKGMATGVTGVVTKPTMGAVSGHL